MKNYGTSFLAEIFLLDGAPEVGADSVLAFLECRQITLDPGGVPILPQCGEHFLRRTDRGAMSLRRVYAEPEAHRFQFVGRHHWRLSALEHVDEHRANDLARDDAQFFDGLWRFDKPDIGACFEIGVHAVDRRL